jgi:hypothetical protein
VAFSNSGIYVFTIQELGRQTVTTPGTALDLRSGSHKIALHDNSLTQGTAPINYSATTVTWASTGQVTGTNWPTGGVTVTAATGGSATFGEGTAGSIRYDMGDVSVASTTIAQPGAYGCIIYADLVTAPAALADAMIVAISFGGTGYPTNNGTFGITWPATGVFELDLTP